MSDDAGGIDDAKNITNKEAWDYFLDGSRDIFTCECCGSEAHRGNPGDMPGALYAEVDDEATIVCVECNEKYAWETVEARIRERRQGTPRSPVGAWIARIRTAFRPVLSLLPIPVSVHDIAPDRRASLLPEHSVFVGRLVSVLGLAVVLSVGIAIFAALTGALFVSPRTGVQWFSITANVFRQWALSLVARPFLVLGVIGLGYFGHLVEYQRPIADLNRERGRSRPHWHYLTFFSSVGLVGWAVWALSHFDVLAPLFLPVGVLAWSAGAFALVYFLNETLLEDRWSYGMRINSAFWKSPAQFAIGLMLYDGVIGLPGSGSNVFAVAIIPPFIGLSYSARRYFAFTAFGAEVSRRFESITSAWRHGIPWASTAQLGGRGGSPELDQFGQLDDQPQADQDRDAAGTRSFDQEQELQQTREWAEYLESELHEREEQMQDLEARLAQVRQELEAVRDGDSTNGQTTGERDDLLTDLFDIRDNFQRALDAESVLGDEATADLSEGIELIDSQIRSILEREGVEEIDTSGAVDPRKHRVVNSVPAADADPGDIVDVYRLGYRLDDRVLREAHVAVAEKPATDDADDPTDDDSQFNRGGDAP